jgi:hypothetical protein
MNMVTMLPVLFYVSHRTKSVLSALNLNVIAGSLGVVTEMTLKCIPQMNLLEESTVFDKSKMDIQEHVDRLRTYRHVRYMWVPYTNTVVTVVSNPTDRTVASNNVTAGKNKALKTGSIFTVLISST